MYHVRDLINISTENLPFYLEPYGYSFRQVGDLVEQARIRARAGHETTPDAELWKDAPQDVKVKMKEVQTDRWNVEIKQENKKE